MYPESSPKEALLATAQAGPEIRLLNGGAEAFPAMLSAIAQAKRLVHLEIYTFALDRVGLRFVEALKSAAGRGIKVYVTVDGWGSFATGKNLKQVLSPSGCKVKVYNPLTGLLSGKLWRNHRKILFADDQVVIIGGINIADAYDTGEAGEGWADLAVELRGAAARRLSERFRRGKASDIGRMIRRGFSKQKPQAKEHLHIYLSGLRGGGRMRQRYLKAIKEAKKELLLAHAYFFPNGRFIRALRSAALRGVRVRLLLAGKSDVWIARSATMRLYQRLLSAGVEIHEWVESTLHAKTAVIDGRLLLLGSFNLDPLSLVNLETLVEVEDLPICSQVAAWIEIHLAKSPQVTLENCRRSGVQRWLTDRVGLFFAATFEWVAHYLGRGRRALPSDKRVL